MYGTGLGCSSYIRTWSSCTSNFSHFKTGRFDARLIRYASMRLLQWALTQLNSNFKTSSQDSWDSKVLNIAIFTTLFIPDHLTAWRKRTPRHSLSHHISLWGLMPPLCPASFHPLVAVVIHYLGRVMVEYSFPRELKLISVCHLGMPASRVGHGTSMHSLPQKTTLSSWSQVGNKFSRCRGETA